MEAIDSNVINQYSLYTKHLTLSSLFVCPVSYLKNVSCNLQNEAQLSITKIMILNPL